MTGETQLTSAEVIAGRLAHAGCRHAFGMPGGEVLVLLDALAQAGVQFTLCKHENAAGFMAEGSWHATGAPGILLTTVGPGLANCINSVANAFQEQVPLIVLSGCIDGSEAERFTHQVIDQRALMAPITKAHFQVASGTASHVVQKALSIAMADPPGPVHIDLPVGLAAEPTLDTPISPAAVKSHGWPAGGALQSVAARLARAERPIILAGLGAVLHQAGPALSALVRDRNIPIITTYKAKGLVDERDEFCLGGHGLSPLSDQSILPLLANSDCVLLAGYDPIEMRSGWIDPWKADDAIELNHADIQHGMHGASLRVVGDVAELVSHLNAELGKGGAAYWPNGEPASARSALKSAFRGPDGWGPHAVFRALQTELDDGAILTADSGAHRILLSQMLECKAPGTLLQSSCFCTMGVSVPLAIGRAIAEPDKRVVAVVGDAGFDMTAGDLATLRDSQARVLIIVLVDDSLALIEKKQTAMQLPSTGVLFQPTDISSVTRAYGGYGAEVTDAEALKSEMNNAKEFEGFAIISCRIEKDAYQSAF